MYILASVLFETNHIYIFTSEIWKTGVKPGFSVHNINLYVCSQEENNKWILCS